MANAAVQDLPTKKLRIFNLVVGVFQLLTGALIAGITDVDAKAPWYTNFIESRDEEEEGFYEPRSRRIENIAIGYLSAIFLFMSAADHLLVIMPGINSIYNKYVARGQNPFRWLEYFFSASVMRVMIAQLSGTTDVFTLVLIFGTCAVTMLFGHLMEHINATPRSVDVDPASSGTQQFLRQKEDSNGASLPRRKVDWTPLIMGFIPHAFSWSVVIWYFLRGVIYGDPPGFVWAIIFILFFTDLTFAWAQWAQFGLKSFAKPGKAEMTYIILSLTSKQILAWVNYGGTQSL